MRIKNKGVGIPELAKKKSILDQDSSELLVGQALEEMFRILSRHMKEKKALKTRAVIDEFKKACDKTSESKFKDFKQDSEVIEKYRLQL
jgi:hypothetical protein